MTMTAKRKVEKIDQAKRRIMKTGNLTALTSELLLMT